MDESLAICHGGVIMEFERMGLGLFLPSVRLVIVLMPDPQEISYETIKR